MPKKSTLVATLSIAGGGTRHSPEQETTPAKSDQQPYQQPGRVGLVPIGSHFPETVRDQLKLLAIERRTSSQDLLPEALNDLFAKYRKPEIAPRVKKGRRKRGGA